VLEIAVAHGLTTGFVFCWQRFSTIIDSLKATGARIRYEKFFGILSGKQVVFQDEPSEDSSESDSEGDLVPFFPTGIQMIDAAQLSVSKFFKGFLGHSKSSGKKTRKRVESAPLDQPEERQQAQPPPELDTLPGSSCLR
jgi:hypothetical protein